MQGDSSSNGDWDIVELVGARLIELPARVRRALSLDDGDKLVFASPRAGMAILRKHRPGDAGETAIYSSTQGSVQIPSFALSRLMVGPGDALEVSIADGRAVLRRRAASGDAFDPTWLPLRTDPRPEARGLWVAKVRFDSFVEPIGAEWSERRRVDVKRYAYQVEVQAYIERLASSWKGSIVPQAEWADQWSGWKAATPEAIVTAGPSIAVVLEELASLLKLEHEFDPEREHPGVTVVPAWPPEIESALADFRERWTAVAPANRMQEAIGPAIRALDQLGWPPRDIAWIFSSANRGPSEDDVRRVLKSA